MSATKSQLVCAFILIPHVLHPLLSIVWILLVMDYGKGQGFRRFGAIEILPCIYQAWTVHCVETFCSFQEAISIIIIFVLEQNADYSFFGHEVSLLLEFLEEFPLDIINRLGRLSSRLASHKWKK